LRLVIHKSETLRVLLKFADVTHSRPALMNRNVYVIIPVYNRIGYTRSCLRSLREQTISDFKIIVIDDGSTDGTSNMIVAEFPDVVLLRGDGNLWWTRSINLGVEYAIAHGAEYVITLNDDIVLSDNFLEKMLFHATENPKALLGGIEIDSISKQMAFGGKVLDWKLARYSNVLDKLKVEDRIGLHEVNLLPGRALLIPADVFRNIGLFDQKHFPQTIADIDFTYRAHSAGYKIFSNYDAIYESYPDTKGGVELRTHKSLKNYYTHLFGIKGKGNLAKFLRFGWKNCPRCFLPSFLVIGASRRVCGYLLEWFTDRVKFDRVFNRLQ
jgi:GT2 family glycosyltransferase